MISFATPGGGVGPHFDSYDVFLFQASGRRRWKIGRQKDFTLQPGVPLKILQNSKPTRSSCWKPATCSTCRRAMPMTALPRPASGRMENLLTA